VIKRLAEWSEKVEERKDSGSEFDLDFGAKPICGHYNLLSTVNKNQIRWEYR
jgi:hypothetical protein